MKYILVIGDGMADHPLDTLGGRTPLEASKKDAIDAHLRLLAAQVLFRPRPA